MKKGLKLFLIVISVVMLISAFAVISYADGEDAKFSVTDKDGNTALYYKTDDLISVCLNIKDGDRIKLLDDLNVENHEGWVSMESTRDNPKTVYLDLAGHGIYSKTKTTLFNICSYITLNVYSSAPEAFFYSVEGATWGGCVFNISGKNVTVNFGTMTVDGVEYPGSNLSTFSSCVVNVSTINSAEYGFFGDGGNHFASAADWKGFICQRNGYGTISFKNSNLAVIGATHLVHSEVEDPEVRFENCVMIDVNGKDGKLFNGALCQVYFKNCVSTFSIISSEAATIPVVNLEGDNVFGSGLGFNDVLVKDADGMQMAKINADYTFIGGETTLWGFDGMAKFTKVFFDFPNLDDTCLITSPENVIECKWVYDDTETVEYWHKDAIPEPPVEIPFVKQDGMYRSFWLKRATGDNAVTYTAGIYADFPIKVAAEYDGRLRYHVMIPAFLIDEGFLDFGAFTIDGGSYDRSEWEKVTLEGEEYYMTTSASIEEEEANREIEIFLPCDFIDANGKNVESDTIYVINLEKYLNAVLAEEDKWTEDEMTYVEEMSDLLDMLKEAEDADDDLVDDPALLPEGDESEDEE